MLTIEHITAAHRKVKSGADFPAYVKEIKQLGVTCYETFVSDGHTDFYGADDWKATLPAKYPERPIAAVAKAEHFKVELSRHQLGKTDYPTFIGMCADSGIEKWIVRMDEMTCTYLDKDGRTVLVETIRT